MEETRKNVRYLQYQDVTEINKKHILTTGGLASGIGRPMKPEALHYLIDIVKAEIQGQELFPTIHQKAASYAYHIIKDHIFVDGNKRTGMTCAFYFLSLNGITLSDSTKEEEIIEVAAGVANSIIDMTGLTKWLQEKSA